MVAVVKALKLTLALGITFLAAGLAFNAISPTAGNLFWLALFVFGVGNLIWWATDRQRRPSKR